MEDRIQISNQELLDLIPQKHPFKFVDEITELDENYIVGRYKFQKDAPFYQGHFPDFPITPGVILLESMAQIGVTAFALYLLSLEMPLEDVAMCRYVFCDGAVEFFSPVLPGDRVLIRAEKISWRKRKLRSRVEMFRDQVLVANSTVAGIGIKI